MAPPSSASCSTAVARPQPRPLPLTSSSSTLAPLRPLLTPRLAMPFASFTLPTPPSVSAVVFHPFVGAGLAPPAAPHPVKILTGNIFDRTEFLSAPVLGGEGNHTRPTLKIQDGCDSRCSYCVIPFVRGKSRSLPPA